MFELRTLGRIDLTRGQDGAVLSLLSQPKRLAVLVYLAARGGTVRRESLLPVFWPDLDETHARGALSQTLYRIRRSLGASVLEGNGSEDVGLYAGTVWCDAVAFDEAVTAGRHEAALDLYRGPFLDAFQIDSAAFQHWADGERERLRSSACEAAVSLARAERSRGHPEAASIWLRRALAVAPTDEAVVEDLMRVLAGSGEYAEAIRAFESFTQRMEREFDLEPAEETRALADAIRAARRSAAGQPAATEATVGAAAVPETATERATAPVQADTSTPVRPARRVRWSVGWVAFALLGLALYLGSTSTDSGPRPQTFAAALTALDDIPCTAEAKGLIEQGEAVRRGNLNDGSARSTRFFAEAVAADSSCAPAWAGLSWSHLIGTRGRGTASDRDAHLQSSAEAARRAVQLGPDLVVSHLALAEIAAERREWVEAERSYRHAIELDSGWATPRERFAYMLAARGRIDEALAEIDHAVRIDPQSAVIRRSYIAGLLYVHRDIERGLREARDYLRIDPRNTILLYDMGEALADQLRTDSAIATFEAFVESGHGAARYSATLVFLRDGPDALRDLIAWFRTESGGDRPWDGINIAHGYALLNEPDSMFAWLDGIDFTPGTINALRYRFVFDEFRDDPRYGALLEKAGVR